MSRQDDVLDQARSGSEAAIGQLITALESGNAGVLAALGARLSVDTPPAPRIGITGAPGVGKSSLIAAMTGAADAADRIGVLAVDPSSDGSGGAILGDRFRLYGRTSKRSAAPGLYFRSMGSRGSRNAISRHLGVALALLEYAGMTTMFVETAGAGQTDIAVRDWVDCLVLVLSPDSGDAIQMMKSGLMEWADIFVVNKGDRPGARAFAAQLRAVARVGRSQRAAVHVVEATGVSAALSELRSELELVAAQRFKDRRAMWKAAMAGFMEAALVGQIKDSVVGEPRWLAALDRCAAGELSIHEAVSSAWDSLLPPVHSLSDGRVGARSAK
jgi:GTPase